MARVEINTEAITNWESFHEIFKREMGFPEFYGMNMNAWIDCLSYLDNDDKMTRFQLRGDETLHVEVQATESFKSRVPEIFDALVECAAFVNQQVCRTREETSNVPHLFVAGEFHETIKL